MRFVITIAASLCFLSASGFLGTNGFLGESAMAQAPAEVLTPYKAYKSALKEGDRSKAARQAYAAWQAAEELIGDSRITGDLADNYARSRNVSINDKQDAFKRAIALASYHGEDAYDVEVQRHIKYIEWMIENKGVRFQRGKPEVYVRTPNFKSVETLIEQSGQTNSTYEAELLALKSQYNLAKRNFSKALKFAELSIEAFSKTTDNIPSHYVYLAQTYKAESLYQLDRLLETALVYQDLMTDIDKNLGVETAVSKFAYASWLDIKDILEKDGKVEDMKTTGISNYELPKSIKEGFHPLIRVPSLMPKMARKSGHVKVIYNVDINGAVQDPKIVSSTDKIFERGVLKAVRQWRYPPNGPADKRQNIESKVSFRLVDSKGKLIPE